MPTAKLDDVEISYVDEGKGAAIFLVHGFASSKEANWIDTGWVELLVEHGYRVIAHDNRGHGKSTKFHSPADYTLSKMAGDVLGLMRFLKIEEPPHLMGYSMGARISTLLAIQNPALFAKVILAGNGYGMVEGSGDWTPVREALLAPSLADVTDARGWAFRKFADQTGSDLKALADCVTAVRELFKTTDIASITNQVLIAIGTKDDLAGSGEKLSQLIKGSQFLPIPNRDHMRAVGDKVYKAGVLEFLKTE